MMGTGHVLVCYVWNCALGTRVCEMGASLPQDVIQVRLVLFQQRDWKSNGKLEAYSEI